MSQDPSKIDRENKSVEVQRPQVDKISESPMAVYGLIHIGILVLVLVIVLLVVTSGIIKQ